VKNVVFMVKNGIGYGHLRRALILAEALLDAGKVRPLIVSQASSLNIYEDSRVPVVNFPLLHRVPSAVAEDWYTDLLDKVLDHLDPAVIIEDTYPDQRYAGLPSLADRPRLLVLRRLDRASFDSIRTAGAFARYARIFITQSATDFAREGHSDDSSTAVEHSGRFHLVGPVHRAATPAEVGRAHSQYAKGAASLIVASGGAGGDQMPDGYGDRFFHACHTVATRLGDDRTAPRFVLVTGPYYAGRPLPERANVIVREYEPNLHALLAAADVAVIKPGHNVLSETLTGGAQLILVPDVSFMEGLDEHARRTVNHYGGAVARPDPDDLEPLIRTALMRPKRDNRLTQPPRAAIDEIVAAVHEYANHGPITLAPPGILLALRSGVGTAADDKTAVVADLRHPERFHRHVRAALANQRIAHIALDTDRLEPDGQTRYTELVHKWLAEQQIQLLSDTEYHRIRAQRLLEKQ
jgi:predicted glycosyltransferase